MTPGWFVFPSLALVGLGVLAGWLFRDQLRRGWADSQRVPAWLAHGSLPSVRRRVAAWRDLDPQEQRWLDDTMAWLAEMKTEDDRAVAPKAVAQRASRTVHAIAANDRRMLV